MGRPFFSNDHFDQLIIQRLYEEQEHLLWAHKVPLKRAVINLFDSEKYWGKWDAETRTIFISRRLIQEHSWFCVESILRHEMAHQCVTEIYGCDSHLHDDLFRKCCRLLGVPDEFSGASASLQETSLDWKTHKQDEPMEKLLSKVQKLLALATSSNEHEALLAMEKVREIYARHNLDEYVRQGNRGEKKPKVHLIVCHGKKRIEAHQSKICGILVGHFFVRVIFCKEFDSLTGEEYQAFQLIGTRENVLMAEYVYYFLLNQTECLVNTIKKQRGPLSRVAAKSYRLGILQGFHDKLEESDANHLKQYEQQKGSGEGTQLTTIGNALTILKSDQGLAHYMDVVFPRLQTRGGAGQYIDDTAYAAGKKEGGRLTLHRGVTDHGGNLGRLLPTSE
ncbi:DUF2786 domain-containing protein [Bdellovibrionota bacterium FG-1]